MPVFSLISFSLSQIITHLRFSIFYYISPDTSIYNYSKRK
nr:MAG TPA: hypothetical protein [Caudoviricetes sp.]